MASSRGKSVTPGREQGVSSAAPCCRTVGEEGLSELEHSRGWFWPTIWRPCTGCLPAPSGGPATPLGLQRLFSKRSNLDANIAWPKRAARDMPRPLSTLMRSSDGSHDRVSQPRSLTPKLERRLHRGAHPFPGIHEVPTENFGKPCLVAGFERDDHLLMLGNGRCPFSGPSWPMKRMRFSRVCKIACISAKAAFAASWAMAEWIC